MKPEQIHLGDWYRLLIGTSTASILAEVVLRIVVLYVVLALAIRAMGKRTSSELTRNELMAISALAAGMGPAVQAPDRGLLPPIMIAAWVVLWQRAVAAATFHSPAFERAMQGDASTLVENGRIDLRMLKKTGVSRERVLSQLRIAGVTQLGQVERLYLEADGAFSMVRRPEPEPGLTVVPTWDAELLAEQQRAPEHSACAVCGKVATRGQEPARCTECESTSWTPATLGE
jgi:uncharacterized membrane protein YcaP (DUF421 family)